MSRKTVSASLLLAALCLAAGALPAQASCKDDIARLQARIDTSPKNSPNAAAANKELAKAIDDVQYDEVGCDNDISRGWRALNAPPAQVPLKPGQQPPPGQQAQPGQRPLN
jgi:hypothetical protein